MRIIRLFVRNRAARSIVCLTFASVLTVFFPVGLTYRFGIGRPDQSYIALLDLLVFAFVSFFYFSFVHFIFKRPLKGIAYVLAGLLSGLLGGLCALLLSESLTSRGLSGLGALRSDTLTSVFVIAFGTGAGVFGFFLSVVDLVLVRILKMDPASDVDDSLVT